MGKRSITEQPDKGDYSSDKFEFAGFSRPESNYFRMPNNWTDITARINSLAELKVVEYILRHTWGFQEFGIKRRITIDEFIFGRKRIDGSRMDLGTRLSEQSVRNGLKQAIEDGFILEEVDTRDLARIKKYYCLRMVEPAQPIDTDECIELEERKIKHNRKPVGVKTLDPKVQVLDPEAYDLDLKAQNLDPRSQNFRPRTEKDNTNKLNQNNHHKQAVVEQLLVDYGVSLEVAREISQHASLKTVESWMDYVDNAERVRDRPAFLVKMLRSTDKPVSSRPTGRAQNNAGINYSAYTNPDGKYHYLLKNSNSLSYSDEE
ncbi:hypothetical protein [Candidatus Chlorohelix sp.]|uniref:hypothetical protein n=1 Tax=Candidatus Chlorohelix sp. TaxID=3139201 RepID=UPI00304EFB51